MPNTIRTHSKGSKISASFPSGPSSGSMKETHFHREPSPREASAQWSRQAPAGLVPGSAGAFARRRFQQLCEVPAKETQPLEAQPLPKVRSARAPGRLTEARLRSLQHLRGFTCNLVVWREMPTKHVRLIEDTPTPVFPFSSLTSGLTPFHTHLPLINVFLWESHEGRQASHPRNGQETAPRVP